jgi:hypothetical protein
MSSARSRENAAALCLLVGGRWQESERRESRDTIGGARDQQKQGSGKGGSVLCTVPFNCVPVGFQLGCWLGKRRVEGSQKREQRISA